VQAASRQADGVERHPRLLEQYGYRARVSVRYAADPAAYRSREIEHFTVVREAVRAGRAEALRMHRAGEIHDRVLAALEAELDLQEMTTELSLG
jgi:CPA1 family monovalent cation:H+ antiporter